MANWEDWRDRLQTLVDQIKSKFQKAPSEEEGPEDDSSGSVSSEDQTRDIENVKMVDAYGRTIISAPIQQDDEDGEELTEIADTTPTADEATQIDKTKNTNPNLEKSKTSHQIPRAETDDKAPDEAQKKRSMLIKVAALVAIVIVGLPEIMNLLGTGEDTPTLDELEKELNPPAKKRKRPRPKPKKKPFFPNAKSVANTTADAPAPKKRQEKSPKKPQEKLQEKLQEKRAFFPNAKTAANASGDGPVAGGEKRPFFPKAKKAPQQSANTTADSPPKVVQKTADATSDAKPKVAQKAADATSDAKPKVAQKAADATSDAKPKVAQKAADATSDVKPKVAQKAADATSDAKPKVAQKTADATSDAKPKVAQMPKPRPSPRPSARAPASVPTPAAPPAAGIPPETPARPLSRQTSKTPDASGDSGPSRGVAQVGRALAQNEIEYTSPPNYQRLGRGLIYNCDGKHWACVDKFSYFQCRENQVWNERHQRPHECVTRSVYASSKDCTTVQKHYINTVADTDFCDLAKPAAE